MRWLSLRSVSFRRGDLGMGGIELGLAALQLGDIGVGGDHAADRGETLAERGSSVRRDRCCTWGRRGCDAARAAAPARPGRRQNRR